MSQIFLLGWEEWLSLPDLGLPAIKAKIDTGARTSSLHADNIEVFGSEKQPKVRFDVHPVPGRDDIAVRCTAIIVDRREVVSSNGDRELRYVIRTMVAMGGRSWPIEVTLANREAMAYRMLIGRQAIQDDMFVDPAASFRQPRLSYNNYPASSRLRDEKRVMEIALFTRRPDNASNRRIVRAAEQRGHHVSIVDRTRLSLYVSAAEPALFLDGKPLLPHDAIIARAGRTLGAFSIAAIRQFETLGAFAPNSAEALWRVGDPLAVRQALARDRITVLDAAVSHSDLLRGQRSDGHVLAEGPLLGLEANLRVAVIGGRCLAVAQSLSVTSDDGELEWHAPTVSDALLAPARRISEVAARSLGLGFALIEVAVSQLGPVVIGASANVPISALDRICGTSLAEALIVHIEQSAKGRTARI